MYNVGNFDKPTEEAYNAYYGECKPELFGNSLDDSFYNCQECDHTECEYWAEYNLEVA